MILGDSRRAAATPTRDVSAATVDHLFRRTAQRRPDALALVDPANRASFTDGEPRRLTYAEADRAIAAIAGRLRHMGLPTDAIVGVQLPNIVENVLTILGVLRAGMIAAPLPLLWRRADAAMALARNGAKALITCGRVGTFDHARFALRLAAEVFSVRYVGAFGKDLPDGLVPFDDLLAPAARDLLPDTETAQQDNPEAHVAVATFDIGESGPTPIARNHSEMIAGGLAVSLESRLPQHASILSAIAPASFAGLSLTLLPWLLSGGTLVLHHPFAPEVFDRRRRDERCGVVVLPAAIAFRLAEANFFDGEEPLSVCAAWRTPERLAASSAWRARNTPLVDVSIFGETALVAARRDVNGRPSPVPFGPVTVPLGEADGTVVAELVRSDAGTLAVRGPMVPQHAFPPWATRPSLPYFRIGAGGLVDTCYPCRADSASDGVIVTGAPAGIVSIGGYRFALRDLRKIVGRIDSNVTFAALPDPLIGQRLIGNTADRGAVLQALNAVGVNPIVAAAFHDRRERGAGG
jgi:acyl-coenzyme A synthetase/AMP-(fatty) acid ligase